MVIFKPENVRFRALRGRDTTFIEDPNRLKPGSGFYGVEIDFDKKRYRSYLSFMYILKFYKAFYENVRQK